MVESMDRITDMLEGVAADAAGAEDDLLVAVYEELRRMAHARMIHEAPGRTLEATALVHEAYLRILGEGARYENRAHFFGAASEAMRRILVEAARRRGRLKRGGGRGRVPLEDGLAAIPAGVDLIDFDDALARFEAEHPRHAELLKLRIFGGLGLEPAAEVVGVSRATASRWWAFIRAWFYDAMGPGLDDRDAAAGDSGDPAESSSGG